MDTVDEQGKIIDFRINYNEEDENIKLWNKTMNMFEIASKKYPRELKTTLLFSLIQAEQIEVEKQIIDTKFDSLSQEEKHTNKCAWKL